MIIYDLHPPTLHGAGTWLSWLDCPRRASLREYKRLHPGAYPHNDDGTPAQRLGTLTHAYLDLYHRRQVTALTLDAVKFKSPNQDALDIWSDGNAITPDDKVTAQGLVRAWAQGHTWDHFGDELDTEYLLPPQNASPELVASITRAVTGQTHYPWTGRIDLIAGHGGAGTIIDWKTSSRVAPGLVLQTRQSIQVRCYLLAMYALGYQARSGLVVYLIKRKEPGIYLVPVEFPTKREIAELHAMYAHIARIRNERRNEINVRHCYDSYSRPCEYLQHPDCQRY